MSTKNYAHLKNFLDVNKESCILNVAMQEPQTISLEIDHLKLQKARGNRSITEVARVIGISRQHLWNIETGKRTPSAEILARLCFLYDLSVAELTKRAA